MTDLGLGFRIDQVKNPAGYAFPVLTDARGVRRPATAEEAQMWALLSRLLAAADELPPRRAKVAAAG